MKEEGKRRVGVNTIPEMTVNYPNLRPNTKLPRQEIGFVFNCGGMGDYIYWVTAIDWAITNHPHLYGTICAPRYFVELAEYWFKKHVGRFTVRAYDKIETDPYLQDESKFYLAPDDRQLHKSTGAHLLNIGFQYYANLDKVPSGWAKLPRIEKDTADITKFNLPPKFAVITTEATSPIRKLPAETINGLTKYARENNITPVFLGKKDLHHDYRATHDSNIKTENVIDLREKTTTLEAATILANALYVVGLDNGLLHLAATTDTKVIMGFNTVDPRHRVPPREISNSTIAVTPPEDLKCRFCQSHVRYILGHNFHYCLYQDPQCLDYLNAPSFINAIEKILETN